MGLLSTIARSLGLQRSQTLKAAGPLRLTDAAIQRLGSLPEGHGIEVRLMPAQELFTVSVTEGPIQWTSPALEPARVQIHAEHVQRMHGLSLHHDVRWQITAEVTVYARETPNPDSRMYFTNHPIAEARLFFGPTSVSPPQIAAQLLERSDVRTVLLRDNTLSIERTPAAPWDAIDRAVDGAVRAHVLGCGGALGERFLPERDDPLEQAVQELLEARVLPMLHADGGDLELVALEGGVLYVRLVGACRTCPASQATLSHAVERAVLDAFPGEIDRVEAV